MTRARTKAVPSKAYSSKAKKGEHDDQEMRILTRMVAIKKKRNDSSTSYESFMKAEGKHNRNKGWRKSWRNLIEEGYIQSAASKNPASERQPSFFTSNYELTDKGKKRTGSDEKAIEGLIETMVSSTEEQHNHIRKNCLNNRAIQIFDLLLKHGSMTRKEVAATIGINDRGGPFSYGLRELKRLDFIAVDESKSIKREKYLMVSQKAFMNPKDRPEPILIDPDVMSANIEKVYGKERRKAAAAKSSVKKESTIKAEQEATIKKETSKLLCVGIKNETS